MTNEPFGNENKRINNKDSESQPITINTQTTLRAIAGR